MQDAENATPIGQSDAEGFWPKGRRSIVDFKIGIVPLPIFLILFAVIGGFAAAGTVRSDYCRDGGVDRFDADRLAAA
jgi:malate:Na+ symporter